MLLLATIPSPRRGFFALIFLLPTKNRQPVKLSSAKRFSHRFFCYVLFF